MDAGADDAAAGANRAKCRGDERADGRENDGGIERLVRQLVGTASEADGSINESGRP